MVPPAGPGVFTVNPSGPGAFKLVVTGHTFTSRGEIEKYLAYRAARHTVEQGGTWFTLNEDRGKGETALPMPARDPEGDNRVKSTRSVSITLNEPTTHALLHRAPRHFGTQINDLLLSALALTLCRWSGHSSLLVELEGHGRENLFDGVDLSRTVGWFTSPQMVRLEPVPGDLPASIRAVRTQLRRAPHHGLGYAITRYLTEPGQAMAALPFPQVFFNYLGQFDQLFEDPDWLAPAGEPRGDERCPDSPEDAWFGAGGVVHGGRLRLDFRYSVAIHDEATARELVAEFAALLREIVRLCAPSAAASAPGASPIGAE